MKKSKMNLISLMALTLSLSGCWDPVGSLVSRYDRKPDECRIYETIKVAKDEIGFKHKETLSGEACDGMWGVNTKTLGKIISNYNAWLKQESAEDDKP